VSTRNLIRDRFLAAGQGGYYVESSVLQDGVVRGHFHTACRMLGSTRTAPEPAPVPAFFVATEDRQGGRTPDTVAIQVPGLPQTGTAQCASWAGDGSHRIPMMQRANQTPAFDAVRIRVRAAEQPPAEQPPAEQPPAEQPPAEQPPAEQPPAEQPPAEEPPAEQPPAEEPPAEQPPAEEPPAEQPPAEEPPAEQPPAQQPPADSGDDDEAPAAAPPAQPRTNSGPVTRTTTRPPAASSNNDGSSSTGTTSRNSGSSSSRSNSEPAPAQALTGNNKVIKPEAPESGESIDGAALAQDDGAPDPDPPGTGIKPAAAQTPEADKLALTGNNKLAVIGGGVVIALIGFVVLSATRRRRPRAHYYH
jgi:hypothetical protein